MEDIKLTPLAPAPAPELAPAPVVEPEVAPEPVVEAPKPAAPVAKNGAPFKGRSPCDWNILPSDEHDGIVATNSNTGESFEGSRADFNARLNG
jgi:hypothetical protein